jgi:acyl carrier protein
MRGEGAMEREEIFSKVKSEVEALASCAIQNPDDEIFKSGILDSLNILNIILFMETEFSLKIRAFDVNLNTLGSLNKICDFIHSKVNIQ